jgi:FkbM family methyltransferase
MKQAGGSFLKALCKVALSGKATRRSVAAVFKTCGLRPERRWPFITRASSDCANLSIEDLLLLQYARSTTFQALVIGAFDGETNDPTSFFLREHASRVILVEPQSGPFDRLQTRTSHISKFSPVNAAISEHSGSLKMYSVPAGADGLPSWVEQLASFDRQHIEKHEVIAPGLSRHIVESVVKTYSFADLLDSFQIDRLDLLQIDAEGMDDQLLKWFPFERIKPALLYFETAHMTASTHANLRARLSSLGYRVFTSESANDDMAILL